MEELHCDTLALNRERFQLTYEVCEKIIHSIDIDKNTQKEYLYRIRKFIEFVNAQGIYLNTFLDYKNYLGTDEKLAVSTKNKYLIVARVILVEMNRLGILNRDITKNVKSFRTLRQHKKLGLDSNEVKSIVEYLTQNPDQKRLRVIISLLLYQGLRQIEIRRLKISDINLVNKTALIQGKGNKEKEIIHLHDSTVKSIHDYLQYYKIQDGYLLRSFGNRKSDNMISAMFINREVNELFQKLDINKTVHGFRHFYITTLLKKFEPNIVRKFSRHKSLDMLIVYDDESCVQNISSQVFSAFNRFEIN